MLQVDKQKAQNAPSSIYIAPRQPRNMEMDMLFGEMIIRVVCDLYLVWGPLRMDCAQIKGHPATRNQTETSVKKHGQHPLEHQQGLFPRLEYEDLWLCTPPWRVPGGGGKRRKEQAMGGGVPTKQASP